MFKEETERFVGWQGKTLAISSKKDEIEVISSGNHRYIGEYCEVDVEDGKIIATEFVVGGDFDDLLLECEGVTSRPATDKEILLTIYAALWSSSMGKLLGNAIARSLD